MFVTLTCTSENRVTIQHIPNVSSIVFSASYSKSSSWCNTYAEHWA